MQQQQGPVDKTQYIGMHHIDFDRVLDEARQLIRYMHDVAILRVLDESKCRQLISQNYPYIAKNVPQLLDMCMRDGGFEESMLVTMINQLKSLSGRRISQDTIDRVDTESKTQGQVLFNKYVDKHIDWDKEKNGDEDTTE